MDPLFWHCKSVMKNCFSVAGLGLPRSLHVLEGLHSQVGAIGNGGGGGVYYISCRLVRLLILPQEYFLAHTHT